MTSRIIIEWTRADDGTAQDADPRGRKIFTPELDGRTWLQMPAASTGGTA